MVTKKLKSYIFYEQPHKKFSLKSMNHWVWNTWRWSSHLRTFRKLPLVLLFRPHGVFYLALKITFEVCGSLNKHRVRSVSIGCPTECYHGSQRLTLKKCWEKHKDLKCLHNVIQERCPYQMRFWGLPCFFAALAFMQSGRIYRCVFW